MNTSKQKKAYITNSGTTVMLTPQQKAYADAKLNNPPTISKSHLIREINPNITKGTAQQLVKQYENNQSISIYTDEQINQASNNIVDIANNAKNENVKLSANQDILDRTQGKAIQQVQTTSKTININIDLTTDTSTESDA